MLLKQRVANKISIARMTQSRSEIRQEFRWIAARSGIRQEFRWIVAEFAKNFERNGSNAEAAEILGEFRYSGNSWRIPLLSIAGH